MLSLLVHTYKSGAWLSWLAYPAICRMMDHCDHHVEINCLFVVRSIDSSKIHSGISMWFWSHGPAGSDSHCCLPRLLAGDGLILPGSFWNRWNHFRWVIKVWCKYLLLLSFSENMLAWWKLEYLGDLIKLSLVLTFTIENSSNIYNFAFWIQYVFSLD